MTVEELQEELSKLRKSISMGSAATNEDLTTKPTLGYWKIRGLGQQIRYMFAYLNVPFEDKQYEFGGTQENVDRTQWTDAKFLLGLEYPNLPYLIDGDTKLTETKAIMKYIAKKWKPELLGSSAAELGRIEMLSAHCDDLKKESTVPCYTTGDSNQIVETVRPILQKLADCLENSKWLAGDNLSWLDFQFAENLDLLDKISEGLLFQEFPRTQEYFEAFTNLPGLSEYWQTCMKAPFNGLSAKLLNQ